jgi:hypothetical protein
MTVILLDKHKVTFVSKSHKHRINLPLESFVRIMQNKKHYSFLKELADNPEVNYMYNHLNDYHFFKGFVNNTVKFLEA